jgi:hypothetical protein
MVGMKGAPTKPTRKEAAARAAAADSVDYLPVPSEQEFRESLVIISVLKKLGHPEGWDFAAARIIPKGSPRASSSWVSQVTSEQHGWLAIPHLPLATSDVPDELELKVKEMHDSISESRINLRGVRSPPGTWQGSEAFSMALDHGMPTAAEMRAIAIECFPQLRDHFPQYFDDTSILDYIKDGPPSEAAVTPGAASGMRDDLNIAIKQARTEVLARMLDLDNPALSEKERLTRARRVKASFERRRAEDPDFPASPEVQKAVSIVNRDNYRKATARKGKAKLAM